jgi:uncharacterized protein
MRIFLRLSVIALLSTLAVRAVDWKALKQQGCASDFAGVIDPSSRRQVEDYCRTLEHATGAQIAFVTIPSLEREPIEDVAHTIFEGWQIGKRSGQGALLLFAIADHRSRLELGEALRSTLPGGLDQQILLEMRPAIRGGQYGEATLAAASTLGGAIARAKHVSLKGPLERHMRRTFWDSVPWAVLPGALVLLAWLLFSGGTRGYSGAGRAPAGTAGFLPGLASVISRASWGSRGSGGFGGFDSGDTFGGFGGETKGQRTHNAPGGVSGDW